jgi:hypothetical protein
MEDSFTLLCGIAAGREDTPASAAQIGWMPMQTLCN